MLTYESEHAEHLESLNQARALFDAGDHPGAMSLYAHLARQGSATAALAVGGMYRDGLGAPADVDLARQWFEYALQCGSRLATHYLASLHRAQGNAAEALRLFKDSAQSGYLPATYRAASMLLRGDGVPRDLAKAQRYLDDAARGGHVFARRDIALGDLRGTFGRRRVLRGTVSWMKAAFATAAILWRHGDEDDRVM